MKVLIPSPLRSYSGKSWVDATGTTLGDVLAGLDRQYPGIRFRMVDKQDRLRPHMRMFVAGRAIHDLRHAFAPADELHIVQALSRG